MAINRDPESIRLENDSQRKGNWKRWGPYLPERQWATVREDYSADGNCWEYFPHDHARSRAYRWGEDGLLGYTDRQCRVCFATALWNGADPILKERLYGLTGSEGNHGEDVKECYYYLDSTPTHSYCKALYKYPQAEFPYERLVQENRNRGKAMPEFELVDTGVFEDNKYFDVLVEYAKAADDDICIKITAINRARQAAVLHLLPTVWFRNTWAWGDIEESREGKPVLKAISDSAVLLEHPTLGKMRFDAEPNRKHGPPELIFTENDTNNERLYGVPNPQPFVKDAFHRYVIQGDQSAVNRDGIGTKAAAYYQIELAGGEEVVLKLRLRTETGKAGKPFGKNFDDAFTRAITEADIFYDKRLAGIPNEDRPIARQAYGGLLWSKQFYYYVVKEWLEGDPGSPKPPESRKHGRNADWKHLYNHDVISMPDKWEYPWYAAWDLAFHMVSFAKIDPDFAKEQLLLVLREWYMHPSGQIPAYEFAFGDVNPPVHAWACWRVYKMTGPRGHRDTLFLERAFQKLLLNFTWWVNRKDVSGRNVFGGGFLGLDNIGVFDRSRPLPDGGYLEQADGTAWMAFYCLIMLCMALELALENPSYEDIASKFFEHFVAITDAMNTLGGSGLWDESDGFYYDQLHVNGRTQSLRVRSMVGLLPLIAVQALEERHLDKLPGFKKRMQWFLDHRPELGKHVARSHSDEPGKGRYLLAIPSLQRLSRVLGYMLEENEFLSPHGIRSLSKIHKAHPYVFHGADQHDSSVRYEPADSETSVFGGNSNWRGPVWFPVNFLLIEALERYYHFYGNGLLVQCPASSGQVKNLDEIAQYLQTRLIGLFRPDSTGQRPCHGADPRYASDPHWRDLILFYEYFDADSGRGIGASHQTGWTGLVTNMVLDLAKETGGRAAVAPKPMETGAAARPRGKAKKPTSNTKPLKATKPPAPAPKKKVKPAPKKRRALARARG
jgi:hypothetical protein